MNRITKWVHDFFGFSRRETNAFLILIPLMVVLVFSEPAYRYWFVRQPQDFSNEGKQLDSLMATWSWSKDSVSRGKEILPITQSAFDPNRATKDELLAHGLSPALANRILSYRNKGGKFSVKKDLRKIYGMDSAQYKKLYPLIDLPEKILTNKVEKKFESKPAKPAFVKFDLNTADTTQLINVYGIGTKLSLRIIAYRQKLGGFISENQLSEVYGLDSAVVKELLSKSFIDKDFVPVRIDLNKATEKELGAHPYIKFKMAKAIVAYRAQHGSFSSPDDLKKITIMDEKTLAKIKPYVLASQ